jgi:hypothetical protein
MLTDKQYEGIGRLALAVNDIEATVDIYLPFIVGAPEVGVSFLFSEEAPLSRKLDRFKRVVIRQNCVRNHVITLQHVHNGDEAHPVEELR